jgi:hypothetical protein
MAARKTFAVVHSDGGIWLYEPTGQAVEEEFVMLERIDHAELSRRRPQLAREFEKTRWRDAPRIVMERP